MILVSTSFNKRHPWDTSVWLHPMAELSIIKDHIIHLFCKLYVTIYIYRDVKKCGLPQSVFSNPGEVWCFETEEVEQPHALSRQGIRVQGRDCLRPIEERRSKFSPGNSAGLKPTANTFERIKKIHDTISNNGYPIRYWLICLSVWVRSWNCSQYILFILRTSQA